MSTADDQNRRPSRSADNADSSLLHAAGQLSGDPMTVEEIERILYGTDFPREGGKQ
jgi:hypothetical protein